MTAIKTAQQKALNATGGRSASPTLAPLLGSKVRIFYSDSDGEHVTEDTLTLRETPGYANAGSYIVENQKGVCFIIKNYDAIEVLADE